MGISCFLCLFLVCGLQSVYSGTNSLSKATTQFTFNILKANGNSNENVFFSPASISACLGMLYAGSAGQTKDQINKALFDGLTDTMMYKQMQNLSMVLNKPSDTYNMSIANRLYAQNKFKVLKDYLTTLKTYFQSEIKSVDFANKADKIRNEINDWVSDQTNDKIKNMFPPDSLDASTILVLVNAIYFKGTWVNKFLEADTSKKTFYSKKNQCGVDIDMMTQKHTKYKYFENSEVQVLGLPYTGDKLDMFVILPKQRFGLKQVESTLSAASFQNLIQGADTRTIDNIQFPKFKLEKELPLNDILRKLGMTDMFNARQADLSGIDGKKDLVVSKAIHKAFVEVNEKGTEATASTGIVISKTSRLGDTRPPVNFIADHPFLFTIIERSSSVPLFFGRYVGK